MPRRPSSSAVREPLAHALGSVARVAALRVLVGAGEQLTQREVARRAGLQHRSIQLALHDLVALGLISRWEGGRDHVVRLQEEHRLVPAIRELFRREADHFLELRQELTTAAARLTRRSGLAGLALFGSVARGTDRPDSDLDLLVLVRHARDLEPALAAVGALAPRLQEKYGARLRPIGYVVRDAARLWRRKKAPFADMRQDAMVLAGPPLPELLHGTA